MATTEELNDAISENAEGPRSVTADGISVQQHNIADQTKARNDRAAQTARRLPAMGMYFTQLKPPGGG